YNLNASLMLEDNINKIEWIGLSTNSNAIALLEANYDKIFWPYLCKNTNPHALHLFESNLNTLAIKIWKNIITYSHIIFDSDNDIPDFDDIMSFYAGNDNFSEIRSIFDPIIVETDINKLYFLKSNTYSKSQLDRKSVV